MSAPRTVPALTEQDLREHKLLARICELENEVAELENLLELATEHTAPDHSRSLH